MNKNFETLQRLIDSRESNVIISDKHTVKSYADVQLINNILIIPFVTYTLYSIEDISYCDLTSIVTIKLLTREGVLEISFKTHAKLAQETNQANDANSAYTELLKKVHGEIIPMYILINAINRYGKENYYSIVDEYNNVLLSTEERNEFGIHVDFDGLTNKLKVDEDIDIRLFAFEDATITGIRVTDILDDEDYTDFNLEISVKETTNKLACTLYIPK